jgi:NAD(P)-dependent dehydrogenase (short-subunit alcohol dehydrogenase family)
VTRADDFAGLVAVVTGGAAGIGLATAHELSARGALVASFDLVTEVPQPLHGIRCDVTDDASVRQAIATVVDRLGRLDVLVCNAGIGAVGGVEDNDDDEWHRVLDLNVVGMARVARVGLPHLRRSPSAAVVLTSSIVGWAGLPQRALYGASKGAVIALGLAMATDLLADGVRVNVVAPGTADTPWINRLLAAAPDPAAERAALQARQPLGRMVSPDEVAHAIAYLASPRSGSTTGTVLAVDGGLHGLRPRASRPGVGTRSRSGAAPAPTARGSPGRPPSR